MENNVVNLFDQASLSNGGRNSAASLRYGLDEASESLDIIEHIVDALEWKYDTISEEEPLIDLLKDKREGICRKLLNLTYKIKES